MKKSVFIKTWGCQMNVYDSARMADTLAPLGFGLSDTPQDADLVILNTCHIREKATEKVFSELGRLRALRRRKQAEGGDLRLAVAGCVAQAEGEEILARAPYVDIVVGPQAYHTLPDLVQQLEQAPVRQEMGAGLLSTEFPAESKFDHLPEEGHPQGVSAFLSIQEGCDKFCSFCVVPYTRGAEYSRPVNAIVSEAERLIATGAREITLLGQNVNAYHGDGPDGAVWSLARLLYRLAELPGLDRLRYTTSHPRDMDAALIAAHGAIPALMPFLHLPVQSGSDRVLKAMNRKHSADDYRRIIDQLRTARPDIALSSDFIVGHPGEGDADFAATLRLVTEIGFASAYSFKYSPRPGTPAADAEDGVPETVKAERLESLQSLLDAQQHAFNEATIGQKLAVLFDNRGSRSGQLHGRTPYNQACHLDGPDRLLGEIVTVEVTRAAPKSVTGRADLLHRDGAVLAAEAAAF